MKDWNKELDAAAESYATGNHRSSFADTYDEKAFIAGAEWADQQLKEQIQSLKVEIENLEYKLFETLQEIK